MTNNLKIIYSKKKKTIVRIYMQSIKYLDILLNVSS